MKKITKIFVLAIASMVALASCQKVNDVEATFQPKVLKAVFEDELSKTVLSENFQIQWSDSDKITGFDLDCKNYTSTETSVSEDKLEATFTFGSVSLEDDIVYAMYPADAAATMTSGGVITTTLPLVQNAVAGSFDPKANLALANGGEENVKFFNAGGLLAFDIKNDNITKIEIEAGSYENFAGPANLNFAEGEPLLQSTCGSDLHKVTLQGEFINGKTYYAVVFPAEYSSLKMVFTRNDGKTATFTNSKTLTVLRNGVVTVWKNAIDDSKWKGSEPQSETWTATAYADIADGDELVIVGDNGDTYAMSNDNGTSNAPDAVEVTIEGDDLASTPADNIIWVAGKDSDGNITFYLSDAKDKWLYCTSANNGVRVGTNANKTFSLDNSGYLKHIGTSRYVGIYNSADWRCYTSTSGNIANQTFKFYVKKGGATKYSVTCAEVTGGTIAADVVKAEAGATVTLTATPNTGYEFESWNVSGATVADATSATTTFTMPAADVNVSATFKAEAIPDKTIAEFIAAKGVKCYLTGVVSNIVNTTYGNYTLTDASGSIYVFGTLNQDGESRKFAELGVVPGDKIKVLASEYELYEEETDEAKNVTFVEIVTPAPRYAVTVASGIANGTVSVDLSQAAAGQTVTITATPSTGYKVKSVSAKKTASGTAITVTDNKFTMPAEAVTVSAEFEAGSSAVYKKVTSFTAGKKYILVVNSYNKIFDGSNVDEVTSAVDASSLISNNEIKSNATTDAYAVTIENATTTGKYLVKLSSGKYLVINASTSSNGKLSSSTTGEAITIKSVTSGFQLVSTNRSTRGVCYRDGYQFRNYATSNFSNSGYSGTFTLYEYSE